LGNLWPVREQPSAPRPSETAVQPCSTTRADSPSIVWVQRRRELTAHAGARRPIREHGGGLRNGDPVLEFLKPVLDDDHAYEGIYVVHLPRYTRFQEDKAVPTRRAIELSPIILKNIVAA